MLCIAQNIPVDILCIYICGQLIYLFNILYLNEKNKNEISALCDNFELLKKTPDEYYLEYILLWRAAVSLEGERQRKEERETDRRKEIRLARREQGIERVNECEKQNKKRKR